VLSAASELLAAASCSDEANLMCDLVDGFSLFPVPEIH